MLKAEEHIKKLFLIDICQNRLLSCMASNPLCVGQNSDQELISP